MGSGSKKLWEGVTEGMAGKMERAGHHEARDSERASEASLLVHACHLLSL